MTKVFRYGLLAPTSEAERIADQMHRAHQYFNALIALERQRRAASDAAIADDRLRALDAEISAQEEALRLAHASVARARIQERSAEAGDPAPYSTAKRALAKARQERREHVRLRRNDSAVQAALQLLNAGHKTAVQAARAANGLYWGTYTICAEKPMEAVQRCPGEPRFRRWTGTAAVAVQIIHGMDAAAVLGCADSRLQIDLAARPVPGRGGRPMARLRLRIGSTADRGPVFGEWPIVYHRPLPEDARIKEAKVVRERVGSRDVWSVHITATFAPASVVAPAPDPASTVAVDLGWRRVLQAEEPSTRAGGWCDGRETGEIIMDPTVVGALRKADDIRSIRDQRLVELRAALQASTLVYPPEHLDARAHLAQWRSPARFARLALWWRTHRFAGDEEEFMRLESWRVRDRHLWNYEHNTRRRAIFRRREQYRILAARLAARYRALVIERLDLAKLALVPAPDDPDPSHPRGRAQRHATAPHELRKALLNAFGDRAVVEVPAVGGAALVFQKWREGLGVERPRPPARSMRFNRLHSQTQSEAAG